MRHKQNIRKFNRTPKHRKSMLRYSITSLTLKKLGDELDNA